MSDPTGALRDALALTIRKIISGELADVSDARFAELADMWKATRKRPAAEWIGEQVVVTPIHSGWQTIGRLVAIGDKTVELADASPARYPEVEWGRVLVPHSTIASIRIPLPIDTEPNQGA